MSNNYFQFKQFRIEQEHCAMKVTTDACIQGAWTPILPHVQRILDIGTGTGLLSLMMAQRSGNAVIDAIDIDNEAAGMARNNVLASRWAGRITVRSGDVREFTGAGYDLIICNPPFFNNSLLGGNIGRDNARHTIMLSYIDLIEAFERNLSPAGYASVLLPATEYLQWMDLAFARGWTEIAALFVRHTPAAEVKRVVGVFSRDVGSFLREDLVIKDAQGHYTGAFTQLLSPFYLAF